MGMSLRSYKTRNITQSFRSKLNQINKQSFQKFESKLNQADSDEVNFFDVQQDETETTAIFQTSAVKIKEICSVWQNQKNMEIRL